MTIKQEDYVFQMKNKPEEFRQEILRHYAMFLQYYWGEGPLSQMALVHYIFIDCAVYPQKIILYKGNKKVLSNFDVFYGKAGGFDAVLATDAKTSRDYCRTKAENIPEYISKGWIDAEKMMHLFKAIVPQEINLRMVWELSLQNMAKAKGEFKKRLEMALQSKELKDMPAPIKEINDYHIKELLNMYRLGLFCPSCNFEIICLGGIALLKGGDEQILNYMQCENCCKYFISEYKEGFREDEDVEDESIYEIKPKQAASDLKAIKTCPEPYNKHCKCKAHLNYFDSGG